MLGKLDLSGNFCLNNPEHILGRTCLKNRAGNRIVAVFKK